MSAGSVIGAMAGEQSLTKMGGFRKALPFTFVCFLVGGLALSGMPPFSGWLSKDDILGFVDHRGGGFLDPRHRRLHRRSADRDLHVPDDLPRVLRRAVSTRRASSSTATSHHAEVPRNPRPARRRTPTLASPAPGHYIAEREMPDEDRHGDPRRAGGRRRRAPDPRRRRQRPALPGARRSPTRATPHIDVHTGAEWFGLLIGAAIAHRRHLDRLPASGSSAPAPRRKLRERFGAVYTLLWNKWYFDELIDVLVVRPALLVAAASPTRCSSGSSSAAASPAGRSASSAPARPRCGAAQTGFLRYYAALMVVGLAGVALYFLISSSSMTLSILIWLPLASRLLAASLPARAGRAGRRDRKPGHAGHRDLVHRALQARPGGAAVRHRQGLDLGARHPLQARPRRAEHRPGPAHHVLFSAVADLGLVPRLGSPAGLLLPLRPRPRAPCSARSAPRTWRCSSSSST